MKTPANRWDGHVRLIHCPNDIKMGQLLRAMEQCPKGTVCIDAIVFQGEPYLVVRSPHFPVLADDVPFTQAILSGVRLDAPLAEEN